MSAILHTIITSIEDDRHRIHLQSWKKNMKKDKEKKLDEKKWKVNKLLDNRGKLHKKILKMCKDSLKQFKIPKCMKSFCCKWYCDAHRFPFYYYRKDDTYAWGGQNLVFDDCYDDDYGSEIGEEHKTYKMFEEKFLSIIENYLIELNNHSMYHSLMNIDDFNNVNIEFSFVYKYQEWTECDIKGSLI